MTNETTRRIAKTALMIALIFVCTFTIKLPNPATGGYTHMGDCMAFLAVLYLGKTHLIKQDIDIINVK